MLRKSSNCTPNCGCLYVHIYFTDLKYLTSIYFIALFFILTSKTLVLPHKTKTFNLSIRSPAESQNLVFEVPTDIWRHSVPGRWRPCPDCIPRGSAICAARLECQNGLLTSAETGEEGQRRASQLLLLFKFHQGIPWWPTSPACSRMALLGVCGGYGFMATCINQRSPVRYEWSVTGCLLHNNPSTWKRTTLSGCHIE